MFNCKQNKRVQTIIFRSATGACAVTTAIVAPALTAYSAFVIADSGVEPWQAALYGIGIGLTSGLLAGCCSNGVARVALSLGNSLFGCLDKDPSDEENGLNNNGNQSGYGATRPS